MLHPTGRYCARCTYPLSHLPVGMVHIDHCYRCGGSFLDLGKASHAIGDKAEPRNWPTEALTRPPYPSHLMCPSGHGRMWAYVLSSEDQHVEVDACPVCHGIWLDAREAEHLFAITNEVHLQNARPGASKGKAGIVGMYLVQLVTQLPIEVHHPVKRKAVLMYSLVAVLTLIFGLEVYLGVNGQIEPFMAQTAFYPNKLGRAEAVWSLITYAFLHGGIAHLLGNLYFLWIFGDNVEDRLGKTRFTILYLVTGVIAALTYYVGNMRSDGAMVGASGAIAGLMGAYFILFPRVKLWVMVIVYPLKIRAIWYLLFWVGTQFLIMLTPGSNVAWLAHLGGFVSGVGLGWLLKPKDEPLPQAAPAFRAQ